ncbi:SAC3 family protein 1 [Sesbania bispinosa]|nr:SAC3 family protein 1 [Sesbania bispinosa]
MGAHPNTPTTLNPKRKGHPPANSREKRGRHSTKIENRGERGTFHGWGMTLQRWRGIVATGWWERWMRTPGRWGRYGGAMETGGEGGRGSDHHTDDMFKGQNGDDFPLKELVVTIEEGTYDSHWLWLLSLEWEQQKFG